MQIVALAELWGAEHTQALHLLSNYRRTSKHCTMGIGMGVWVLNSHCQSIHIIHDDRRVLARIINAIDLQWILVIVHMPQHKDEVHHDQCLKPIATLWGMFLDLGKKVAGDWNKWVPFTHT